MITNRGTIDEQDSTNAMFPTQMPGLFPDRHIESSLDLGAGSEWANSPISELLEEENVTRFTSKQKMVYKTNLQSHMISQLDGLVYITAGYQFIKFSHSTTILPLLLHVSTELLLACSAISCRFTPSSTAINTGVDQLINLNREREQSRGEVESDADVIQRVYNRACSLLYWKSFITFAWHIMSFFLWLLPLVSRDELDLLENGGWWFVSFIGESVPTDVSANSSIWIKMIKLGLPGIIFTELLIFMIQLTLFQSIYRQSTLSMLGHNLHENELEILRKPGENSPACSNLEMAADGSAKIFRVRLYEVLNQ
ncbi:Piso0_004781 [Millerozyma farinosa CBS 7064]|uniref:Piso0_004781 protein n=1 Tax=Pichia sorbitophila (strain ATCC MYA-4447 / BCRC 22081 / CBS 7064 / NBRC 10061 / NRRL Y-12695) TaxID=559304 RepID=G8Y0E5_PICSO|nr:Piso0_004781 [Millerozyma farinosa CBS 7064]